MTTLNAAEKLVKLLPTTAELTVRPATGPATGSALTTTFIGNKTVDLALILSDTTILGGNVDLDAANLVTPAFEAAAKSLSTGVLGDVHAGESDSLFAENDAEVFELLAAGVTAGWFAVRVRDNGNTVSNAPLDADRLKRIFGVEMQMTVEIGNTRLSLRDIADMEPGTVFELDRSAGAPADIKVNGKLFAQGEIVVIDQDYAVRVTRIIKGEDPAA